MRHIKKARQDNKEIKIKHKDEKDALHALSGSFLKSTFVFSQADSLSVTFRLSVDPVDFQPTTLLSVYFLTY